MVDQPRAIQPAWQGIDGEPGSPKIGTGSAKKCPDGQDSPQKPRIRGSTQVRRGGNVHNASLSMVQLLQLIKELLELHEVRLCMSLIDSLSDWESFACTSLPGVPPQEFQSAIHSFVERSHDQKDEGLDVLGRYANNLTSQPPLDQFAHSNGNTRKTVNRKSTARKSSKNVQNIDTIGVSFAPSRITTESIPEEPEGSIDWQSEEDSPRPITQELVDNADDEESDDEEIIGLEESMEMDSELWGTKDGGGSGSQRIVGVAALQSKLTGSNRSVGFGRAKAMSLVDRGDQSGCIIHPNSAGRLTWDSGGLLLIIGETLVVPLSLGFNVEPYIWWTMLVLAFFVLDMVSQFFTGFYMNGIYVTSQRAIAFRYMTTYFWVDIVATMPWDMLVQGDTGSAASLARVARAGKMLRMLRLLRVFRLRDLMTRLEEFVPKQTMLILKLLKILMLFGVLCHWAACLWGFLGLPDPEAEKQEPYPLEDCEPGGPCEHGIYGGPWLRRYGLDRYNVNIQYVIALKFAAGLLTASEMGLEPGSTGERIYVLVMMIASFILCSIVLSQIVVVVNEINRGSYELKQQIRAAQEFMKSRKIPQHLIAKVKRYLEFQHDTYSAERTGASSGFMQKLSPWIRLEITEHMNRGVLTKHAFFEGLPRHVLKRVCGEAKTVLFAPGDLVVQRGHRAVSMCFLVRGRMKIKQPKSQRFRPNIYLDPPSYIGDLCLFKDNHWRTHTVLCVGHVEVLTITKEEVLDVLMEFPQAKQYYEDYKAKVLAPKKEDEDEDDWTNMVKVSTGPFAIKALVNRATMAFSQTVSKQLTNRQTIFNRQTTMNVRPMSPVPSGDPQSPKTLLANNAPSSSGQSAHTVERQREPVTEGPTRDLVITLPTTENTTLEPVTESIAESSNKKAVVIKAPDRSSPPSTPTSQNNSARPVL